MEFQHDRNIEVRLKGCELRLDRGMRIEPGSTRRRRTFAMRSHDDDTSEEPTRLIGARQQWQARTISRDSKWDSSGLALPSPEFSDRLRLQGCFHCFCSGCRALPGGVESIRATSSSSPCGVCISSASAAQENHTKHRLEPFTPPPVAKAIRRHARFASLSHRVDLLHLPTGASNQIADLSHISVSALILAERVLLHPFFSSFFFSSFLLFSSRKT